MDSLTTESPTPAPRRHIDLRFFLIGREVSEVEFLAELARQGGRASVEVFDLATTADARYRPPPAAQAVAAEDVGEARP
jgi:hypothetical protein